MNRRGVAESLPRYLQANETKLMSVHTASDGTVTAAAKKYGDIDVRPAHAMPSPVYSTQSRVLPLIVHPFIRSRTTRSTQTS